MIVIDKPFMEGVLKELAKKRPIFHSEADFQHSLAVELREKFKDNEDYGIRLELPQNIGESYGHVDIVIIKNAVPKVFIELKYKTEKCTIQHECEWFKLKKANAPDSGCYQFVKDIARIEELTKSNQCEGFAIFLTNSMSYLKNGRGTQYENFSFFKNELCSGRLHGIIKTRKGADPNKYVDIKGNYKFNWKEYSQIPNESFKYLLIYISN